MQRSAELNRIESKSVAQLIRCARQFFQLAAPFRLQEIELLGSVRETAQANSEEPNLPLHVAMLAEQLLNHCKNLGIEQRWLRKRLRPRIRVETRATNRQRQRPSRQACLAQALTGLLRKM